MKVWETEKNSTPNNWSIIRKSVRTLWLMIIGVQGIEKLVGVRNHPVQITI